MDLKRSHLVNNLRSARAEGISVVPARIEYQRTGHRGQGHSQWGQRAVSMDLKRNLSVIGKVPDRIKRQCVRSLAGSDRCGRKRRERTICVQAKLGDGILKKV